MEQGDMVLMLRYHPSEENFKKLIENPEYRLKLTAVPPEGSDLPELHIATLSPDPKDDKEASDV